jgi:hypothetical protein
MAISTYEERLRTEARAKLATIAKEMGHFLAALIGQGQSYPCASSGEPPTPCERSPALVSPWPGTEMSRGSHPYRRRSKRTGGLPRLGDHTLTKYSQVKETGFC